MNPSGSATFQVDGRITFDSLSRVRAEGEAWIAEAEGPVVIDLTGLEHGNSAAVALLMAWWREAEHQEKAISFVGAPAALRNIVELSGVSDILPLGAADQGGAQS